MVIDGAIADLGSGLLPAAASALLTVRTGASAFVESITLVNADSSNRTCNIYLNRDGTRRRISPKDVILRVGYSVTLNDGYSLQQGDKIEGDASAASAVEYTINGVEKKA